MGFRVGLSLQIFLFSGIMSYPIADAKHDNHTGGGNEYEPGGAMAHILFTRLCREIRQDEQTGKNILMGETDNLAWVNSGVGFVLAVYWLGYIGESFSLSYELMDKVDNILTHPPTTECEFIGEEINVSIADFPAAFPHPGAYHINIYQNGLCTKTIALDVIEFQRSLGTE